jgi:hypothetical protein
MALLLPSVPLHQKGRLTVILPFLFPHLLCYHRCGGYARGYHKYATEEFGRDMSYNYQPANGKWAFSDCITSEQLD